MLFDVTFWKFNSLTFGLMVHLCSFSQRGSAWHLDVIIAGGHHCSSLFKDCVPALYFLCSLVKYQLAIFVWVAFWIFSYKPNFNQINLNIHFLVWQNFYTFYIIVLCQLHRWKISFCNLWVLASFSKCHLWMNGHYKYNEVHFVNVIYDYCFFVLIKEISTCRSFINKISSVNF